MASNVAQYGHTARWAPLASALCIAFLLVWRYGLPRLLPGRWRLLGNAGPLVLLIVTAGVAYSMPAAFAAADIPLVGHLVSGLPAVTWPAPPPGTTQGDIGALVAAAVPCALVGYMESLSIATTVARRHGPYDVEPTVEMAAVGVANMATGLLHGYPVTGSFSRTAVNAASGSRSGLAVRGAERALRVAAGRMLRIASYRDVAAPSPLPQSLLSSLWILVILLALMPTLA
jgi:MFS superfamily sulfate permease-like transporter